jgi:hypothetical protein
LHDRIELLSDDRFARIGQQARRGEVEQHREIGLHRWRRDSVAEPDVDLQPHTSCRDPGEHFYAHAAVFLIFADRTDQRADVKHHAVITDIELDHLGEDAAHPALARITDAEQVDVTRRAMRMPCPQREQRCALEDEAPLMSGPRQPIQQTLIRVAREQELEVVAAFASEVKQP